MNNCIHFQKEKLQSFYKTQIWIKWWLTKQEISSQYYLDSRENKITILRYTQLHSYNKN